MKKSILLLISGFAFVLMSCTDMSKTAIVNGIIDNQVNEVVSLTNLSDELSKADTAILNKKGKFQFKIDIDEEGFYMLRHGRERNIIYLAPGYKLKFEVEAEKLAGKLDISGNGKDINLYLMEEKLFLAELKPQNPMLYGLDEEMFIQKANDVLKSWQGYITEQENLSPEFKKKELYVALYDWALTRLYYQQAHRYFRENDSFIVSSTYYNFLDTLDINNPEFLELQNYRSFIQMNFSRVAENILKENPEISERPAGKIWANYEAALSLYPHHQIKSYALFRVLKEQLDYYGIDEIDEIYQNFLIETTVEKYKKYVKKSYNKWKSIEAGNQADEFSYPDINGKEYALNNFKGKYLYIDVWATWCGPCKVEIPYLDTLVNELKGNNIEIISISIDEKKADWEEMINADKPDWLQLYAGSWNTEITNFFLIRSIPRFILLDREGKIIDANAARPSENIKEQILALEGI